MAIASAFCWAGELRAADQKAQDLTEETAPVATDQMLITDNGTQRLRRITIQTLLDFMGLEMLPFAVVEPADDVQDAIDAAHTAGGGTVWFTGDDFDIDTGLTLYEDVILQGAGIDATTISTDEDIVMMSLTNDDENGLAANGFGIRDLEIDGNDAAETGLFMQRIYGFSIRNVRITQCVDQAILLHGCPVYRVEELYLTDGTNGIVSTRHDSATNTDWWGNQAIYVGGRWEGFSGVVAQFDLSSNLVLDGVNVELSGTDDNTSTGGLLVTNMSPGGEKLAVTIRDSWFERLVGGFAIKIDDPDGAGTKVNFLQSISKFHGPSGGDLDNGIVLVNGANSIVLKTADSTLDDASVADVLINDNYWIDENTDVETESVASGHVARWPEPDDFTNAGWSTFASEDFEGVTAPAVPASLTSHADLVTSTSSPIAGTNDFVCSTTPGAIRTAVFDNQDGNSGDARFTARVNITSGGTQYSEARFMTRMDVNTGEAAEGLGFIIVADAGAVTVQGIKSHTGTETTPGTARALAFGTNYDIQVETEGTNWGVSVQRVSDGFYMNSSGTFGATPVAFLSTTDADVAGQGYIGAQIYRHAAGAYVIKTDNWLAEIAD